MAFFIAVHIFSTGFNCRHHNRVVIAYGCRVANRTFAVEHKAYTASLAQVAT